MNRLILGAALISGSILMSNVHAQQSAGEVYQWKDSNGVTHYSQTPPSSGKYQQRLISNRAVVAPVSTASATEKPENTQCTSAKSNIALFEAGGAVGQDTNGDGKADTTLNDAQRASQRSLAEAAVKAYCTG